MEWFIIIGMLLMAWVVFRITDQISGILDLLGTQQTINEKQAEFDGVLLDVVSRLQIDMKKILENEFGTASEPDEEAPQKPVDNSL